jgi:hypothetical protein
MKKYLKTCPIFVLIASIFFLGCKKNFDNDDTDDEKMEKKLLSLLKSSSSNLSKDENKKDNVQNNLAYVSYKYEDSSMSYFYDLIIKDAKMMKNIDARIFNRGFFGYQDHKPNQNGTVNMSVEESARMMSANLNRISVDIFDNIKNIDIPNISPLNIPSIGSHKAENSNLNFENTIKNIVDSNKTQMINRVNDLLVLYNNKEYKKFLEEHKKIKVELTLSEFTNEISLNKNFNDITDQTFLDGFLKIPDYPIPVMNYDASEPSIKKTSKRRYFNKIYNQAIQMEANSFYKVLQSLFIIDRLNPMLFNSYINANQLLANHLSILNDPIVKEKYSKLINLSYEDPRNFKKIFLELHVNYDLETNSVMKNLFSNKNI